MAETGERFEVKMSALLKRRLIEEAAQEGSSVGELIVRLVCRALDLDPARGLVPRRPVGRPPKKPRLPKAPATGPGGTP